MMTDEKMIYFIENKERDAESEEVMYAAIAERLREKTEAEEYRTPKKIKAGGKDIGYWYNCPTCGETEEFYTDKPHFCDFCGQALDWSEVN